MRSLTRTDGHAAVDGLASTTGRRWKPNWSSSVSALDPPPTGSLAPPAHGTRRRPGDKPGRISIDGVYAAGDVSAWWDEELSTHRRVEHYDTALFQGQRVAHHRRVDARTGKPVLVLERPVRRHAVLRRTAGGRRAVWRGGAGFWLRQGRVAAVVSFDDGRTFRRALSVMGTRPATDALLDDSIDLRSLRPAQQPEPAPA